MRCKEKIILAGVCNRPNQSRLLKFNIGITLTTHIHKIHSVRIVEMQRATQERSNDKNFPTRNEPISRIKL